jgi:hypothetical protein
MAKLEKLLRGWDFSFIDARGKFRGVDFWLERKDPFGN